MLQDLRLAVRLLLKNPGFAAAAILTLALGIGANTAIFSVVDGVLLRRAPVDRLDRLVMVWETDRNSGTTREPASVPDYLDYAARSRTLEAIAAIASEEVNLAPPSGDPVRLAALRASHRFLPMLGIRPIAGRTFAEAEDRAKGPDVILISDSLWARTFNRASTAIGATLRLDDRPHTIVGVVPDAADFGVLQVLSSAAYSRGFADRGEHARVEVWLPLQPDPETLPRDTHPIFMIGRLVPGATAAVAQQEIGRIAADLERAYRSNDGRGAFVEPLGDVVFGDVRPALYALLGAVALVLLVACVNVANLLLARAATRSREVAVRTALGAGVSRLARQFLAETLVLTLVAAALGVALAFAGLRALVAVAPADIPRLADITLDPRVLAFTLGVSVAVGLAFGLVPLFQARHVDLQSALKREGGWQGSAGRSRSRIRRTLVVAELALALVLTVGAGLLINSVGRLLDVDTGFKSQGVLKAEYQLPAARYPVDFAVFPDFKEFHAFTQALLQRAAALPGVQAAAIAGNHPLDPGFTNSFTVVGREAEADKWPEMSIRRVTPGYFSTVGLPLARGRLLRDADSTKAPPVVVINEAAARRFFAGRDPLGAQIRFWGASRTVVGVVINEKFQGLAEAPPLAVYTPLAQAPSANGAGVLLLRSSGDPLSLASSARAAIRDIDPGLAVFGVEPLDRTVSRSVAQRRFAMLLLVLFAGVALVLAAIGIHGVLSYGVAERTREIGIRMALGAPPRRVLQLIVGEGLLLTLIGLAVGVAGAFWLTRTLTTLLYGLTPTDPPTFAVSVVLLAGIAAAATLLPARRAMRVDPSVTLRMD